MRLREKFPELHSKLMSMSGTETAIAFWGLLLPVGLKGGALSHVIEEDDGKMDTGDEGFKDEYIQWWFEFLTEKGLKGVSKDTWMMVG